MVIYKIDGSISLKLEYLIGPNLCFYHKLTKIFKKEFSK